MFRLSTKLREPSSDPCSARAAFSRQREKEGAGHDDHFAISTRAPALVALTPFLYIVSITAGGCV